ncbi:MAG: M28 family peptidase, partial [Thermoleophilia bacterium]
MAIIIIVVTLFTLGRPGTPKLSGEPVSFDGTRAAADLRTLVEQFPLRVAGSDPDNRAAIWVDQQFKQAGLETHIEGFPATVNGKEVALQNVWAVSPGESQGSILLIANRDTPPLATQGANDNGSGTATLLELARAFTVTAHDHDII